MRSGSPSRVSGIGPRLGGLVQVSGRRTFAQALTNARGGTQTMSNSNSRPPHRPFSFERFVTQLVRLVPVLAALSAAIYAIQGLH